MPIDQSKVPVTTPEQNRSVGRFGEKTKINKETFEIVGVDTGTVFGKGTNLGEALALQTAGASGSAPTVAGRPDLLATEQRPGVKVESFVDPETGQTIQPKVATPQQLQQRADGTLESYDVARGLKPPASPLTPTSEAPTAPPPITDYATALKEATAAGVQAKKEQLLGAPEDYDNQILRQKGALMTKLLGKDLTPDDLKWLTTSQVNAVNSTGPDGTRLLEAEIAGLNTIVTGRREMKKEEEEKALKQFEMFVASGTPVDQLPTDFLNGLDSKLGLPSGTHASIYKSQVASSEQEKLAAEIETAQNIVSLLNDIPVGQEITVGGSTYTGLSTKGLMTGTEEDANGNVTLWTYDPATGTTNYRDLGAIGNATGWELKTDANGVKYRENANTGQIQAIYDPNKAGGAIPTGGLFDAAPQDSRAGQCGFAVRMWTGFRVVDPDAAAKGIDSNSLQSKLNVMDKSITADTAQIGDVFVQSAGVWTGHTGIISGITTIKGEKYFTVSESNWSSDEKVDHGRQVKASDMLGFARPGLLPKYQFGTDSTETVLDFSTEGTQEAPTVKTINGVDLQWDSGTKSWISPSGAASTSEDQQQATIDSLNDKVDLISNIRTHTGLNTAVGVNKLTQRTNLLGFGAAQTRDFISQVQQLTNQETLDQLISLKAKGGTLGALSDSEGKLLRESANRINNFAVMDKNGNVKGYQISQDLFLQALNDIDTLSRRARANAEGLIYVKQKSTGKMGTVSPSEFNDNEYERL